MSSKIHIKRGLKANLPVLDTGEPAFTTDTKEFFVGDGKNNVGFAKQEDLEIINNQVLDLNFQTVSGTGTEIILTIKQILTNGLSVTFIANADNVGSATNINGKPLYKPNTKTVPNLKAGKAYTVWYNLSQDCFFIKASAEGNTIAAHVLAGDTFSNDDDTGLVGTIPNQPSQVNALSVGSNGTNKYFRIPNGAYLNNTGSGYPEIVASASQIDSNINSNNIRSGVSICGVSGNSNIVDTSGTNANASKILNGFSAWVNGNLVNGNATIQSLGGTVMHYATNTQNLFMDTGNPYYWCINLSNIGFVPKIVTGIITNSGIYFAHINTGNKIAFVRRMASQSVIDQIAPFADLSKIPVLDGGSSSKYPSATWEAWGWD